METTIILAVLLVLALVAAFVLYRKSTAEMARRTKVEIENSRLQERVEQLGREQQQRQADAEARFKAIASGVLMQSTSALQQQNSASLAAALAPVKENFELFRQTFVERSRQDAADSRAMAEHLRELMDLNMTVGYETRRLTDALKGNSGQAGHWGEMILESILQRAGLRSGQEYTVQAVVKNDENRLFRPDVVINYSDDRRIAVDSKVSISAYLDMLDASDDEHRRLFGKAHVDSVRKHITELKEKNYQDWLGGQHVDFVLMFIPHEGAFMAAMQLDDKLWQTAYDANVIIVSPTHLMAVVRLVEQMWRNQRQNRNALEIARQAGLMLDKLNGFLDEMDKIDRNLNGARAAWNEAYSRLTTGKGNLMSRATAISDLGARAKKDLPGRYISESDAE